LPAKSQMLPTLQSLADRPFAALIPISAQTGENLPRLVDEIFARLPVGPPLFPKDMITDRDLAFRISEVIREKLMTLVHKEVPYGLTVEIEHLGKNEVGQRVVHALIWLERESQKSIVIGKQGGVLKQAGSAARLELAEPDNLMDTFFSVGLVFPLGHAPEPAAPPPPPPPPPAAPPPEQPKDSDGDGVPDDKDKCPGTPPGVRVDYRGCEIKEEIELPDVNFEFDSARLTADSSTTLDGAVSTLNRYPELTVECTGHTDSVGTDAYNQSLSERRAHSVCEYLINHGIDKPRLTEHGYGETKPIADNSTAEGRAQNRRVTLRVTGGN